MESGNVITFSNALIPDSTRASLPQKYGFQAGFMDSNVSLSLTFFLIYGIQIRLICSTFQQYEFCTKYGMVYGMSLNFLALSFIFINSWQRY